MGVYSIYKWATHDTGHHLCTYREALPIRANGFVNVWGCWRVKLEPIRTEVIFLRFVNFEACLSLKKNAVLTSSMDFLSLHGITWALPMSFSDLESWARKPTYVQLSSATKDTPWQLVATILCKCLWHHLLTFMICFYNCLNGYWLCVTLIICS